LRVSTPTLCASLPSTLPSRDATEEIVRELRARCADEGRVPHSLEALLDR
jgi:hypothetical protein